MNPVEKHIDWIMDSYNHILNLTASQKEIVHQTILSAYKIVPEHPFSSNLKNETDLKSANGLEWLQGMQMHAMLEPKFGEILTPAQYEELKKMTPRPEDCFSLSKEYNYYWCSNAK
jgi:hypothetical protein